ncbi:MAG: response regulator [Polyangiaceae bacterium]|nr:response regulator [Polyangiaceae bacterium]
MSLALPFGLLLVQRERQRSRSISRMLRGYGFDVIAAPSVAMAEVLECTFDAGVVELDLDDGDGLALARELLASGRVEEVVFFTAGGSHDRLQAARSLGVVIDHREGADALVPVLTQLARTRASRASAKVTAVDTVPDEACQWRAG